MSPAPTDWTSRPFPALRHLLIDLLDNSRPHLNHALAVVDITEAESRRHALQRETRQAISFHAWAMHCLTRAALDHPTVLTYRHGKELLTFNTVDLSTLIDRRLPNGVRIPVGWTLRRAESLSLLGVNAALRMALKGREDADTTTVDRRRLLRLPPFVRRWRMRQIASNPHLVRRYFGNIGLTNLQMPGLNSPFTPLPPSLCTVSVALGSITREIRPDQQGHPQQRTLLHLAAAVDHAVVDGIPGAAFYMRFHDLLSSGHGLDDTYLEEFQTRRSTP